MNDLEEKEVNEFTSNGFKCPTCFAVMGRKCDSELKWCAADKVKCVEFSGIVNTGTLKDAVFCRHRTVALCHQLRGPHPRGRVEENQLLSS